MCCSCFVRLPCCAFGPDKLQVQDDAVCAAPFQLLFFTRISVFLDLKRIIQHSSASLINPLSKEIITSTIMVAKLYIVYNTYYALSTILRMYI